MLSPTLFQNSSFSVSHVSKSKQKNSCSATQKPIHSKLSLLKQQVLPAESHYLTKKFRDNTEKSPTKTTGTQELLNWAHPYPASTLLQQGSLPHHSSSRRNLCQARQPWVCHALQEPHLCTQKYPWTTLQERHFIISSCQNWIRHKMTTQCCAQRPTFALLD